MWIKLKQLLCWHKYQEQKELVTRGEGNYFKKCSSSFCTHNTCHLYKWLECIKCQHKVTINQE